MTFKALALQSRPTDNLIAATRLTAANQSMLRQ